MADLKSRVWGDFNHRLADVHAVRFLIAEAIEQLAHDGGQPTHDAFLHHIHATKGNAIVTTNWDITLDSAILRAGRQVNYASGASPRFPDQIPKDAGAGTALLKLHGSLNWGRCSDQECGWTAFRDGKVAAALHLDDPRPCGTCGQPGLEPAFVPPMAQKMEETNTSLQNVWQIAFRTLRQSTSVVIVGHSLPRTDIQVEMLLVDAIGREDSAVGEVHVVGPRDAGRDDRFRRLRAKLGRDVPFWTHDRTYEAWAGAGCLLEQGRPLKATPAPV